MDPGALIRRLVTLGMLASGSAQALTPAEPNALESGHSAVWFDAGNPGTGWVIEMLRDDRAAAYWYGFDDQGRPVWRIGAGKKVGDPVAGSYSLVFEDLYAGSGARFGDGFDPAEVVLDRVGAADIFFNTCEEGRANVNLGGTESTDPLDRLTRTMGAGCEPINGIPGFPVRPYAGQSGAWYDPDRNGEGITLQWMARDEAVLYWFTYDLEGNPFWLFGVGSEENGAILFPMLYSAGRNLAGEVQLTEWGSLALDLDCNAGTLTWASVVEGFGEGNRDLRRLNRLASPTCPTVRPKLTERYDLEVVDLPMPAQLSLRPHDIADDGTVLATAQVDGRNQPWLLPPEPGAEWVSLGGPVIQGGWPVDREQAIFLSQSGSRAVAGVDWQDGNVQPVEFTRDDSTALPDFGPGVFRLAGASADRSVLTGRDGDAQPWVWNAGRGVRTLPLLSDPESGTGVAIGASDDGGVVLGVESVPRIGTPPPEAGFQPGVQGLIWDKEGNASLIRDPDGFVLGEPGACNVNCSIVFGVYSVGVPRDSERRLQPWFWTRDGRFGGLEGLEFTEADGRPIWGPEMIGTSRDGTIALGDARSLRLVSPAIPPIAFVWTQATNLVIIKDLLEEIGAATPETTNAGYGAIAISGTGRHVLFRDKGTYRVLVLSPK